MRKLKLPALFFLLVVPALIFVSCQSPTPTYIPPDPNKPDVTPKVPIGVASTERPNIVGDVVSVCAPLMETVEDEKQRWGIQQRAFPQPESLIAKMAVENLETTDRIDITYHFRKFELEAYNAAHQSIESAAFEVLTPVSLEVYGLYPGKTKTLDKLNAKSVVLIPKEAVGNERAKFLAATVPELANVTFKELDIYGMGGEDGFETFLDTIASADMAILPGLIAYRASTDGQESEGTETVTADLPLLDLSTVLAQETLETADAYVDVVAIRAGGWATRPDIVALKAGLTNDILRQHIANTYKGTVVPAF